MARSEQEFQEIEEDQIIVQEVVNKIIDYIVENDELQSDYGDEESTTTCNIWGRCCGINIGFNHSRRTRHRFESILSFRNLFYFFLTMIIFIASYYLIPFLRWYSN